MQTCKTLALHVKVKSKAVPLQATKGYMRSTVHLWSFLTSTLDYVSGQLHAPAALPLGKSFWCLRKVGRAPESVWTLVKKEKCLFPLQAIELRSMQPVAYIMGAQIFQKSRSHLRILVAGKVT
jgi:hypothetical protein